MGGAIGCQQAVGNPKIQAKGPKISPKPRLNCRAGMVKGVMTRFAHFWSPLRRLAALSGLLLAVACATVAPKPPPAPPPPPPAPAAPLPLAAAENATDLEKFAVFLLNARVKALADGITPAVFDRAVGGIAPIPAIAQMNLNQPEFIKPVWSYLDGAVSARRIADGKSLMAQYAPALAAAETRRGVPKEILVAIWGMETDYGHVMGGFNLFAALATLAYDGPRQAYAAPEFFAGLKIAQDQHFDPKQMTASWAGAFGQTQFTPTTSSNMRWTPMATARSICGVRRPTRWNRRATCWPSPAGNRASPGAWKCACPRLCV